MIPSFPIFRKLKLEDKGLIDQFTKDFPPYSDFNFSSLYCWSIKDNTLISILNNNLVVQLNDYITDEEFFTFLGTNRVLETANILLDESVNKHTPPSLKLIPEVNLKSQFDITNKLLVVEDRDNFDYIYSIDDLVELKGNGLSVKRNFINRFERLYNFTHRLLNLDDLSIGEEITDLFEVWRNNGHKNIDGIKNELEAIRKAVYDAKFLNLVSVGLFIDGKLVAFSVNDILLGGNAINLFEKADTNFEGVFPTLRYITATHLHKMGCQFLNHEQDLGIPGLRKSKMSYHPVYFLKKYQICKKINGVGASS